MMLRQSNLACLFTFLFGLLSLYDCGVIELGDRDFHHTLKDKNVFVMFYSPNCPHCVRAKPAFHALAARKPIVEADTVIAAVDCTQHNKLCGEYDVHGFPSLKLFLETGDEVAYDGDRELSDLESFVLDNVRPAIVEVSEEDSGVFIQSTTLPVVMGYFRDSNSKLFTMFKSLAPSRKQEFLFGYTFEPTVAQSHSQKPESVVLYRQKHFKCPYEEAFVVETSEKELGKFLKKHRFSVVDIRTPKNAHSFDFPLVTAFLPFSPFMRPSVFKRLRNAMLKVAAQHPETSFAISLKSEYATLMEDMGVSSDEAIKMVVFDGNSKYVGMEVGVVEDPKGFEVIVQKLVEDFKKGDVLDRFVKSQAVPEHDEGQVKTVVGKNFDEVVLNPEKDVLIEFYAPWCGHCKTFAPKYEKLAEILKDVKSLVIAKMDGTANEVHPDFNVEGFPTIYLAAAGKKSSPVQFTGKRDLASIVSWLKKQTTHPIQYSEDIPEEKEEL